MQTDGRVIDDGAGQGQAIAAAVMPIVSAFMVAHRRGHPSFDEATIAAVLANAAGPLYATASQVTSWIDVNGSHVVAGDDVESTGDPGITVRGDQVAYSAATGYFVEGASTDATSGSVLAAYSTSEQTGLEAWRNGTLVILAQRTNGSISVLGSAFVTRTGAETIGIYPTAEATFAYYNGAAVVTVAAEGTPDGSVGFGTSSNSVVTRSLTGWEVRAAP